MTESARRSLAPDQETATEILGYLAGLRSSPEIVGKLDQKQLALWLVDSDLGSLGKAKFSGIFPEIAARLQVEMFQTAATNTLHWHNLQEIDVQLASSGTPAVLLKGAALAGTVYEGPEQRSMADVDLWLRQQDIVRAGNVMEGLGFHSQENAERPLELQALSDGEFQYVNDHRPPMLVELHLSPFPGWWLQRTAAINRGDIWLRKEPLHSWLSFCQLAAEDAVIHMAVHLAVNHQFGMSPLRGLLDIALTDQVRQVDWDVVADRAQQWRVGTAVWLVLSLVEILIGTPRLETVLNQLQPSALRRRQLRRYVSPESILAGDDFRNERERYLFLLLLVDRPQDAGRLVSRTIWPETEWLDARYGGDVDNWQHIRRLIQQGDI